MGEVVELRPNFNWDGCRENKIEITTQGVNLENVMLIWSVNE